MEMYFHGNVENAILFEAWKTTNWWELMLSCIAVFVISLSYEGLKLLRFVVLKQTNVQQYDPEKASLNTGSNFRQPRMLSCSHLLQTLLYSAQVVVAYFLMLVVMTFNIYLSLAVFLGAAVGYLVLSWRRYEEIHELL